MATQIKGKSFQVSDTGLCAFRLRFFCDTEDDALTGIPGSYRGLLRRGNNGAEWDAGADKWIVDVTYQGLASGDPAESLDQFELDGEFREEPIESFSDRAWLASNYGAYIDPADGLLKFPEYLPVSTGSGFSATSSSSRQQNPLFGLRTYPVYYEVATHTYVRTNVPASVRKRKGTIVNSLPGGFEYQGDVKTWFVDAPKTSKRGNAWTITERYKELDQFKAIAALKKLVQK